MPYPTFKRPLAQATVGPGGEGGVERGMDMEEVKEGYEVVTWKVDVLYVSRSVLFFHFSYYVFE